MKLTRIYVIAAMCVFALALIEIGYYAKRGSAAIVPVFVASPPATAVRAAD